MPDAQKVLRACWPSLFDLSYKWGKQGGYNSLPSGSGRITLAFGEAWMRIWLPHILASNQAPWLKPCSGCFPGLGPRCPELPDSDQPIPEPGLLAPLPSRGSGEPLHVSLWLCHLSLLVFPMAWWEVLAPHSCLKFPPVPKGRHAYLLGCSGSEWHGIVQGAF